MRDKYVIWVNGGPGVGKDALIESMRIAFRNMRYTTLNVSSIDPIKNLFKSFGGNPANKTPEVRNFLSVFGKLMEDMFHTKSEYVVSSTAIAFGGLPKAVIFIHVRETDVIDRIKQRFAELKLSTDHFEDFEFQSIHVSSQKQGDKEISNASDAAALNSDGYHHKVRNDGSLADLDAKAYRLVQSIINEEQFDG